MMLTNFIPLLSVDFFNFIIACIFAGVGFAISLVLCYYLIPIISEWMKKRKIVGIDVHKEERPEIPERGGLSILISISVASTILFIAIPPLNLQLMIIKWQLLIFLLAVLIGGGIGYLDDARNLGIAKPLILILPAVPVIVGQLLLSHLLYPGINLLNLPGYVVLPVFNPFPVFPLVGRFHVTWLYFLFILLVFPVLGNGVNMLDVYNGAMSGTMSINFGVTLIGGILFVLFGLSSSIGILLSAVMLGSMIAFYIFNKYPARVFSGNVGSITVGTAMALIAIEGGLEAIVLIVLLPYIINAFQLLASIGKLIEGKRIKERPAYPIKGGYIKASSEPKAPLTLTRIVLAEGPLKEPEIVKSFIYLTIFSAVLAIITGVLCNPMFYLTNIW
ncbi:MAG: hypothetical protein ACTSRB_04690 [Candidatus Helarchaeota archaeon]